MTLSVHVAVGQHECYAAKVVVVDKTTRQPNQSAQVIYPGQTRVFGIHSGTDIIVEEVAKDYIST